VKPYHAGMYRLILVMLVLQFAWGYSGSANWLGEADAKLYHLIHDRRTPLLDQAMPWVSKIGSSKCEIVIAFTLPLFGVSKEASYTSIAATIGAEAITFALKGLINRPRPTGTHGRWNSSFPSGHATSAYAMASVWGAAYPSAKLPLYLIAALIAYSRVYNGRHYPMDVLAGAGIGYLCGRLAWRYRRYAFPSGDHSSPAASQSSSLIPILTLSLGLTTTRRSIALNPSRLTVTVCSPSGTLLSKIGVSPFSTPSRKTLP